MNSQRRRISVDRVVEIAASPNILDSTGCLCCCRLWCGRGWWGSYDKNMYQFASNSNVFWFFFIFDLRDRERENIIYSHYILSYVTINDLNEKKASLKFPREKLCSNCAVSSRCNVPTWSLPRSDNMPPHGDIFIFILSLMNCGIWTLTLIECYNSIRYGVEQVSWVCVKFVGSLNSKGYKPFWMETNSDLTSEMCYVLQQTWIIVAIINDIIF